MPADFFNGLLRSFAMHEAVVQGLVLVLALGIAAHWVALRLGVPAILVLLIVGFVAGEPTGLVDPDALLGPLLFPFVSLSVAVILFEGALGLRLREIADVGRVVVLLTTVGVAVTAVLATLAAHWLAGLPWSLALLLGAMLTVTGPTVIGPLLRQVRPDPPAGPLLRFEGILTDPIGAMAAVLVFQGIVASGGAPDLGAVFGGIVHGVLVGLAVGGLAAIVLWILLRRHQVQDVLESPVVLVFVLGAWLIANHFHPESGLIAVTTMGVGLANQRAVSVHRILTFKEELRRILLPALFVLLAARVPVAAFTQLDAGAYAFVLALVLVVRPATVLASTIGSGVRWPVRTFLAGVAPRGIIAAAVTSILENQLVAIGIADAERLTPLMFLVIVSTVALYGLGAAPLARGLGLAVRDPRGVLIVGANPVGKAIASALRENDVPVVLVDTNARLVTEARLDGLDARVANLLSDEERERFDLGGLGILLALTSNDEANALLATVGSELFARADAYQLSPSAAQKRGGGAGGDRDVVGRVLFAHDATFAELERRIASGDSIKATKLTQQFGYDQWLERTAGAALPLFVLDARGRAVPIAAGDPRRPSAGQTLIAWTSAANVAEIAERPRIVPA
jgi:NhaP-type Na+/H+ or K+/H+ antiporter